MNEVYYRRLTELVFNISWDKQTVFGPEFSLDHLEKELRKVAEDFYSKYGHPSWRF